MPTYPRRLLAAILLFATLAAGLLACTPAAANTIHSPNITYLKMPVRATTVTFPYSASEAAGMWNQAHHDKVKIPSTRATQLAAYDNIVVYQRIARYIFIVRLAAYLRAIAAAQPPHAANWDRVAACESGGVWTTNTGNGFFGGLQFTTQTWLGAGGGRFADRADHASRYQQIVIADPLALSNWPVCGARW